MKEKTSMSLSSKGSTINDLGGGAEEKSEMDLFFPGGRGARAPRLWRRASDFCSP